ncbi:RNA-binding protein [Methanolobus bombayensis]|uniref:RNA-binding protein n=1 Tax=Methanolobus bombayensis TaxID=38023 RepID=UPI001FD7CCBA|nr:RNA-binding protein [Methanolobus bombayensis]MBP1908792.1 RNA binding exosome subunit [Methanolobus bombayensis]
MRVFAHSTEDLSRVRAALDFFLRNAIGISDDDVTDGLIEVTDIEGHYGNPSVMLSSQISRKSDSVRLARFIRERMSSDDVQNLRDEMPERLDDEQLFHMRFDKQAAFQGRIVLSSSSDAITVKVKIATYPKNRLQAGLIVEELFG